MFAEDFNNYTSTMLNLFDGKHLLWKSFVTTR